MMNKASKNIQVHKHAGAWVKVPKDDKTLIK